MAIVSHDSNLDQESNTTNVLSPQVNTQQEQPSYQSDGNPYGGHSSSQGLITTGSGGAQVSSSQPTSSQSRKANTGASSGSFTNVQTYVDKNKASSQNLSDAAGKTLTNTADIAKQNLDKSQQNFQNQVSAGSLSDKDNALSQAQQAYDEAAGQKAATQQYTQSNQAYIYDPTQGTGADDEKLKTSNLARVIYGDGTSKDFSTMADATKSMDSYNAANPGYFQYGEEQQLSTSDDRLKDILNANYTGPTDLSAATNYSDMYNSLQDASALQNQAMKSGDQSELLQRTFSTGQNEYTTGNRLLDNLLLGQGEAADSLRTTAEGLGTSESGLLTDDLKSAQKQATQTAQQETAQLNQIRQDARQALSDTAIGRQGEIESRINNVIENWEQYPQHFRDRFQGAIQEFNEGKKLHDEYNQLIKENGGSPQALTQETQRLQQLSNDTANFDYNEFKSLVRQYRQAMADTVYSRKNMYNPNAREIAGRQANELMSQLQTMRPALESLVSEMNNMRLKDQNGIGISVSVENAFYNLLNPPSGSSTDYRRTHERELRELDYAMPTIKDKVEQSFIDKSNAMNRVNEIGQYADFNPNAFNMQLSQLEAEALGVQGGEGLYNLLKDSIHGTQGSNTIENLLKTAQADKNQLISRDEQSQLARLQSIAELADDYGSANSNANYVNPFSNRDVAGTQNATSALDMNNLRNLMQGAERTFRNDANSSNITGVGQGSGASGGVFGTKRASATKTLTENFGDLIRDAGGYRNMYSDEGMNSDLLRRVINASQGDETFSDRLNEADVGDLIGDVSGALADEASKYASPTGMLTDILGTSGSNNDLVKMFNFAINPLSAVSSVGSFLGGSSSEAQARADQDAYNKALQALRTNITNKVNTSGINNQLSVGQNTGADLELLKLLGILDTTNL